MGVRNPTVVPTDVRPSTNDTFFYDGTVTNHGDVSESLSKTVNAIKINLWRELVNGVVERIRVQ